MAIAGHKIGHVFVAANLCLLMTGMSGTRKISTGACFTAALVSAIVILLRPNLAAAGGAAMLLVAGTLLAIQLGLDLADRAGFRLPVVSARVQIA